MISRRIIVPFALFLEAASAFTVGAPFLTSTSSRRGKSQALHVTYNNMEDLQKAREEFEALMNDDQATLNAKSILRNNKVDLPVLTNAGRHRRELEIKLLSSLADSDDGVEELMHLWMYEHTANDAALMQAFSETCSDGLLEEEKAFTRMIAENPHWAEPRVRLAALKFFKGQTENSYREALQALALKPWHFEISPLLIMLSLRQQDMGQALFWARQGLPDLKQNGPNRRRKEWVARAVAHAKEQLNEAERLTEALFSATASCSSSGKQFAVSEEEMWQ